MGYTLAQFRGYLAAAGRRERRALHDQAVVTAAAFGGGDQFKGLLKALGAPSAEGEA